MPSYRRLNATCSRVHNTFGVPVSLFANTHTPIEEKALAQARTVAAAQNTLQTLQKHNSNWKNAALEQMVLTPDLHRSSKIPVGTVLSTRGAIFPQAIGNDVCCGMRLMTLDLHAHEIQRIKAPLMKRLRAIFFQGERQLALSSTQREALLLQGPRGLHQTLHSKSRTGLLEHYNPGQEEQNLQKTHFGGGLRASSASLFQDWISSSDHSHGYGAHLGSVGGGNHFVELQSVEKILSGHEAHAWNVRQNQLAVVIHTGSLGFGHLVGQHFVDKARQEWPTGLAHPSNGLYPILEGTPTALAYLEAMKNAANFAFGNRLFLGLMVIKALSETLKRPLAHNLVYDVPHNLIWKEENHWIHRKGACPAYLIPPESRTLPLHDPARYIGQPVIVPGSMGSSTYLLSGMGNQEALQSASHGAGRAISRGKARKVCAAHPAAFDIVTPIDPKKHEVQKRPEILAKYRERVNEEAPNAYKPIAPIVDTLRDAKIARPVAQLSPLMTLKG